MIKYLLYGGQGFKIFIKFCVYNSNNKMLDQMAFLLLAYDKMNNVIDSTDIHDEIIEYVCNLQTKRKEKKKKKRLLFVLEIQRSKRKKEREKRCGTSSQEKGDLSWEDRKEDEVESLNKWLIFNFRDIETQIHWCVPKQTMGFPVHFLFFGSSLRTFCYPSVHHSHIHTGPHMTHACVFFWLWNWTMTHPWVWSFVLFCTLALWVCEATW